MDTLNGLPRQQKVGAGQLIFTRPPLPCLMDIHALTDLFFLTGCLSSTLCPPRLTDCKLHAYGCEAHVHRSRHSHVRFSSVSS